MITEAEGISEDEENMSAEAVEILEAVVILEAEVNSEVEAEEYGILIKKTLNETPSIIEAILLGYFSKLILSVYTLLTFSI